MKASIRLTSNGALASYVYRNEPTLTEELSYEFDEDNIEGVVRLLYDLMDKMGWSGDRYDRTRIKISAEHGDKFEHTGEHPKDGCDICRANA